MTLFSHCDLSSWPSFASTFFTPGIHILCNTTVTYFSKMHAYKKWEFVVFISLLPVHGAETQNIGWVFAAHATL